MSTLRKKVQEEMVDDKIFTTKSINIILVPSQRYQDSKLLLQNTTVPRNLMGFSNLTDTLTPQNYLS